MARRHEGWRPGSRLELAKEALKRYDLDPLYRALFEHIGRLFADQLRTDLAQMINFVRFLYKPLTFKSWNLNPTFYMNCLENHAVAESHARSGSTVKHRHANTLPVHSNAMDSKGGHGRAVESITSKCEYIQAAL